MPSYVDAVQSLDLSASDDDAVLALVKRGIPSSVLPKLLDLGITEADVSLAVEHPESGTLTQNDSLSVLRMADVAMHAKTKFGTNEALIAWLHQPVAELGEQSPIASLKSDEDADRLAIILDQATAA